MKTTNKSAEKTYVKSEGYAIEESKLMKLFEDQLKDMYWAGKALSKSLPKMIKNASSDELVNTIKKHLVETETQIEKVEEVFETIGKKAVAKKCMAMEGLIKESEEIMKASEKGAGRDAGIIAAAQKIKHYEIASYGTLRTFAKTLGLTESYNLLEGIVEENKDADKKLTEIAESTINVMAMSEVD